MNVNRVKSVMLAMQRFSWEQGLAAQSLFEIGDPYMGTLLAEEAIHRSTPDGRRAVTHGAQDAIDPGANALPLWWAWRQTGTQAYKDAFDRQVAWFLQAPRSRAGIVYHNGDAHRTMIDGVYHMAPPLAAAGHTAMALEQIRLFRQVHLDGQTKLYHQIWNDDLDGYEKGAFWGCGVGWMLAALALTGLCLGEDETEAKAELAAYLQEGVDAFLPYVNENGLTHDVLDDPSTFEQTAAIAFVCYAIYRGVQAGMLPARYRETGDAFYATFTRYIDEAGYLRLGCNAPTFDRPGISTEDQAFALMCCAARAELDAGTPFRYAGRAMLV